MKTYTTEYTDDKTWVQADIMADDLEEAEFILSQWIKQGLVPPGTEVVGEMEESYDMEPQSY